jgi:hypothetical protein
MCVREDHSGGGEAVNTIASINLEGEECGDTILVKGNDFYSSPKLSPDGTHLAWLTWNHPSMPWDGCELWVGEILPDGSLGNERWVAGGAHESIFQPEWSPAGVLYFASDRNGWWNLQRISGEGEIESVYTTRVSWECLSGCLACRHTHLSLTIKLSVVMSKTVFLVLVFLT